VVRTLVGDFDAIGRDEVVNRKGPMGNNGILKLSGN